MPSDIAYHTVTGGIFSPTGFIGENPAICRTGPIFDRTMMKCSRGILTGETQLRRHCFVTISEVHERTNTVKEILPGAAIISTYGESIFPSMCWPNGGEGNSGGWTVSCNDTIKLSNKW